MNSIFYSVGLASLALSLSSCALIPKNKQVSIVDAAYVSHMNVRLASYNSEATSIDMALKDQFDGPKDGAQNISSATPKPSVADLSQEVFHSAELHTRAATLQRFMKEGAVSGQIGLMSAWLQQQTTSLIQTSKDTDITVAAFQADVAANPNNAQLVGRFYDLLVHRGAERGTAEELATIGSDVQGYERDYAGAAQVDRQQQEETDRLLAAYLSAPRVTVDAPAPPAWYGFAPSVSTTCRRNIFGSVDCTTR